MKRFGNLYSNIWDMDNIKLAHKNAKKGKMHYREVKMVDSNEDKYLNNIQAMLRDKTFSNSQYEIFTKKDSGKERLIHKLPYYPDRIIHHCIMQVLEPIWLKTLICDTYSSIKGRGIHKGIIRIRKALRDTKYTSFCLKMDVKKFYPSLDHVILKSIIRYKIKDEDVLWLLDKIIDSAPGVPIGNYLSQYFGNLYLSGFDHWAKEVLKIKYYFRYCDDIVILHHNKNYLAYVRKEVAKYLDLNLRLILKENWQIFPVDKRGIDFLGYRFFHGYTLLRKSIAIRFKQKVQNIKDNHNKLEPLNIVSSIMSYTGWMKFADSHRLRTKYIDCDISTIFSNVCSKNKIHNPLGLRYV